MAVPMHKVSLPSPEQALPGRSEPMQITDRHAVLNTPIIGPFAGKAQAVFGMGCFWGAERRFWQIEGVYSTSVGYAGGITANPTYQEVCSGLTGHTEVIRVVFDPQVLDYQTLLQAFWEGHDPTQGMRQGADIGTQYRSAIYTCDEAQQLAALASQAQYQQALSAAGFGEISTEIAPLGEYFLAEDYHQQYLHKNPNGYCGIGGTGVSCPVGLRHNTP